MSNSSIVEAFTEVKIGHERRTVCVLFGYEKPVAVSKQVSMLGIS